MFDWIDLFYDEGGSGGDGGAGSAGGSSGGDGGSGGAKVFDPKVFEHSVASLPGAEDYFRRRYVEPALAEAERKRQASDDPRDRELAELRDSVEKQAARDRERDLREARKDCVIDYSFTKEEVDAFPGETPEAVRLFAKTLRERLDKEAADITQKVQAGARGTRAPWERQAGSGEIPKELSTGSKEERSRAAVEGMTEMFRKQRSGS